ncbi:nucleoside deaminase [Mobiluncus mulieris]|uniref:tRNA-specific adenosine deaminase n=1 Tax=Mobiluncus mulieris TaxID=2052 RepID=A0A378PBG4_9ACTO|nr:tRNA adenosine(34) deaminase TadA [Mobiluncus mulieris]NMW62394.1 nucleoside deaminase [Mobiluncus mulieris]NMW64206.1 nucleoside deaminase [Mobiluncus mulieris]STY83826.1 tRNA-specific adenosine deaminase [Mobiluncus mulieris]
MNHPSLSVAEQRALDTAFDLAARAAVSGDVPVGAVLLTAQGIVAGLGLNQREIPPHDPTAHAEIVAMREAAGRLRTWNLAGCTLVVTLEPCTMCAGAIVAARISRLIFGAWDSKAGACGSIRDVVRDSRLNHQVEVIGGVAEKRGVALLQDFFGKRRLNPVLNPSPDSRLDSSS